MKVLLIDDSPDTLAVAKARLSADGHEVICASDGRSGLEAARREKPDLILLDVDMPDVSGFEVCRTLKTDGELSMIPVIFLTGSTDTADKVKGLDLGAVDYVTKPFDAFELRARVRAALRTKHLQDLLVEHARIDPLTELWNRRALMDRFDQEWSRINRHGGSIACIMVDLDHFKRINDTHGHRNGDEMLRLVAKVLAGQCRQNDLAARYGGEEFIILTPDEDAAGAALLAERDRREIGQIRLDVAGREVTVTASFGVADSAGAASPEGMIESADAASIRPNTPGATASVVSTQVSRQATEEKNVRKRNCTFQ